MQPVWDKIVHRNWTNNNAESNNNVLKHQTEWRLLKIPELIRENYILHTTQYGMLRRAINDAEDLPYVRRVPTLRHSTTQMGRQN